MHPAVRPPEREPALRSGTPHGVPLPRAEALPAEPVATFPRRRSRAADGVRWEVLTSAAGVTVTTTDGVVAEARITEPGPRVVVEFWTSSTALPHQLRTELVGSAFGHPAVRARRPVLVCAPTGDSEVLAAVREHVAVAASRVAGVTCLIEGSVGRG